MSNQDFDVYLARASNLSQRYRDEATDKPGPALDSAILTASRRAPVPSETIHPQSWFKRWRVPLSMAAVMMLGVGVTLRTVMQEAKLSSPPVASPQQESAPSKYVEPKASTDSADGVVLGGAATSAPAAAAPPADDLAKKQGTNLEREVEITIEERASVPVPAAPPPVSQDKAAADVVVPAPSSDATSRQDALESKAGSASSGNELAKPKAASRLEQDAPSTQVQDQPMKRDDESMSRSREQAAPGAAESAKREAPEPVSSAVPKAFPDSGPRLPEGHHPIVDGKTYRTEKKQASPVLADEGKAKEIADQEPEAWLRRVAELRRLGRYDEANVELERFRERYPDYPAPVER
jgi:hypothetical protein